MDIYKKDPVRVLRLKNTPQETVEVWEYAHNENPVIRTVRWNEKGEEVAREELVLTPESWRQYLQEIGLELPPETIQ